MDRDINNRMGIGANTNSYKKNATSVGEVTMVIGKDGMFVVNINAKQLLTFKKKRLICIVQI